MMKTEKIQLQPFDNIDSILDKLNQTYQATYGLTQIQILWPRRGKLLDDPLDFGRISGWAERNHVKLVFVSSNEQIMRKAAEHNIPVCPEVDSIPAAVTNRKDRFPMKRSESVRAIRIAKLKSERDQLREKKVPVSSELPLFLVAMVAVVFLFFLIVPHAVISIQPVETKREIILPLWTSDTLEAMTLNGGVPSELMRFTVEKTVTVPASGTIQSAGTLSTGTLRLTNVCDQRQLIPSGTHFSASADQPWLFHNLTDIVLPAKTETTIPIEADKPGASFNLPAQSIHAIEVPYDRCIQIIQDQPTSGGSDGIFITPTQADYEAAVKKIRQEILSMPAAEVQEKAGNLRVPLMQTLKIGNLISEKSDPLIGYAGKTLTLTQTIEVEVRTISRQLIIQQIRMNLEAGSQNAFIPINDSIQFSVSEKTDSGNDDQYELEVRASQSGVQFVDYSELRELISGKTIQDAKKTIREHINLESEPSIKIWPKGLSRLPFVSSNILIEDQQWGEF